MPARARARARALPSTLHDGPRARLARPVIIITTTTHHLPHCGCVRSSPRAQTHTHTHTTTTQHTLPLVCQLQNFFCWDSSSLLPPPPTFFLFAILLSPPTHSGGDNRVTRKYRSLFLTHMLARGPKYPHARTCTMHTHSMCAHARACMHTRRRHRKSSSAALDTYLFPTRAARRRAALFALPVRCLEFQIMGRERQLIAAQRTHSTHIHARAKRKHTRARTARRCTARLPAFWPGRPFWSHTPHTFLNQLRAALRFCVPGTQSFRTHNTQRGGAANPPAPALRPITPPSPDTPHSTRTDTTFSDHNHTPFLCSFAPRGVRRSTRNCSCCFLLRAVKMPLLCFL